MASTDPIAVGPDLNFINTNTPEDFSQNVGSDRRDEDEDMNSASSESGGLEYGTPTQNDNVPHQGSHSQHTGEPNNETGNDIYANGVPGRGWDGSGFTLLQKYRPKSCLCA
jgi:hypothetical protein